MIQIIKYARKATITITIHENGDITTKVEPPPAS